MGRLDAELKKYMSNSKFFADAFNFYIYDGEQVIDPKSLRELDTTEIVLPYGTDDAKEPVQKFRDVLKVSCVGMEDQNAAYLVLGIENQLNIHYAMPVRNMLYDAMQYTKQVSTAQASYKKDRREHDKTERTALTAEEFLSGFRKGDKLIPVITLVIYFGADPWDGPISISDMLAPVDPRLKRYIPDYRMNLIVPQSMTDEEFSKFKTDLGAVLLCVKHTEDNDLSILNQSNFFSIDRESADIIKQLTSIECNLNDCTDEEGRVNMCKALQNEKAAAVAQGELVKAKSMAMGMYAAKMPIETIAQIAQVSVDQVKEWLAEAE